MGNRGSWYALGVRLFVVFLALPVASSAFAQEKTEPYGRFYRPLVSTASNHGAKADQKLIVPLVPPEPASPVCSVPLVEAQIPDDTHFTIRQVPRSKDEMAPMPQTRGPAPACDASSSH
jgi:hypothetical protein